MMYTLLSVKGTRQKQTFNDTIKSILYLTFRLCIQCTDTAQHTAAHEYLHHKTHQFMNIYITKHSSSWIFTLQDTAAHEYLHRNSAQPVCINTQLSACSQLNENSQVALNSLAILSIYVKNYRFKDTCNDDTGIGRRKQQLLLFSTSNTDVVITSVFKTIAF